MKGKYTLIEMDTGDDDETVVVKGDTSQVVVNNKFNIFKMFKIHVWDF